MNVVVKVGSLITQGVSSVATPFHPFGGAVDIIVVQQKDGTFRSTPWYVRFGKFQGVLKGAEKIVGINVNGVNANFHMYLDNSGEAYFVTEVVSSEGSDASGVLKGSDSLEGTQYGSVNDEDDINSERDNDNLCDAEDGIYGEVQMRDERSPLGVGRIERTKSESERSFYELKAGESSYESLVELSESGSIHYDDLESSDHYVEPQIFNSEVVLVSVDGQILTAPISSSDRNSDNLQLSTPQFPPGQGTDVGEGKVDFSTGEETRPTDLGTSAPEVTFGNSCGVTSGSDPSVQPLEVCEGDGKHVCQVEVSENIVDQERELCANSTQEAASALAMQDGNDDKKDMDSLLQIHENADNSQDCLDLPVEPTGTVCLDQDGTPKAGDNGHGVASMSSGSGWLWSLPFRTAKIPESTSSTTSSEKLFVDSQCGSQNQPVGLAPTPNPQKQLLRTNVPTTEQIASLKLTEGQNIVTFSFSTRVWGVQKVDAHIYLWKWDARIVISDVDGTITKSDVLGQFMPLVGRDWTQTGVARLFSAIKENGYQLLFLSARAIVQAYLTRSFLLNLRQDGNTLPDGPVVISPDGLFPSLFREVIRRAPHEFKIACLEDIKALFPSDYNPFYAGFGNRDTDELSYRKMGIPKGKIFIINPKGEVAISQTIDAKSYTSLHTLVNDMFPPTFMDEEEDYNPWNYWRLPPLDIDC